MLGPFWYACETQAKRIYFLNGAPYCVSPAQGSSRKSIILANASWRCHLLHWKLKFLCPFMFNISIRDHYRPRSEGDNVLGSVRPSVCQFVCPTSPAWTVWPLTLIFCTRVDLDLGYAGIVGQGRRSKVKVKCQISCFDIIVTLLTVKVRVKVKGRVKVMGRGQRSNFWRTANSNRGHYQSKAFVCVSLIRGRIRIIARRWSIGF